VPSSGNVVECATEDTESSYFSMLAEFGHRNGIEIPVDLAAVSSLIACNLSAVSLVDRSCNRRSLQRRCSLFDCDEIKLMEPTLGSFLGTPPFNRPYASGFSGSSGVTAAFAYFSSSASESERCGSVSGHALESKYQDLTKLRSLFDEHWPSSAPTKEIAEKLQQPRKPCGCA